MDMRPPKQIRTAGARRLLPLLATAVVLALMTAAGVDSLLRPAAARAGSAPQPSPNGCVPLPAPGPPLPGGGFDDYPAGWNLISGYGSMPSGALGPLYTYNLASGGYDMVSATGQLDPANGYWAYFPCPIRRTRCAACPPVPLTVTLPAGQYVMIGNPSSFPIATTQTDATIYLYDPVSGYHQVTTLGTGQGAWVYSAGGTTLRLR
jgi:hypothetical protein